MKKRDDLAFSKLKYLCFYVCVVIGAFLSRSGVLCTDGRINIIISSIL